jgi:hypothetical protein
MCIDAACSAVRHKVSHRNSIAADDDGLAVLFQLGQQAGKVGFRFMNIHRFHENRLVLLVNYVNGRFAVPVVDQ